MSFTDEEIAYMRSQPLARVATLSPDGNRVIGRGGTAPERHRPPGVSPPRSAPIRQRSPFPPVHPDPGKRRKGRSGPRRDPSGPCTRRLSEDTLTPTARTGWRRSS